MTSSSDSNADTEREIALHVLQGLVDIVSDPVTMTIDLWRLHRIIVVMRGIVTEADPELSTDMDFDRVASTLAGMISTESKNARDFRRANGVGLMDLVLRTARQVH